MKKEVKCKLRMLTHGQLVLPFIFFSRFCVVSFGKGTETLVDLQASGASNETLGSLSMEYVGGIMKRVSTRVIDHL